MLFRRTSMTSSTTKETHLGPRLPSHTTPILSTTHEVAIHVPTDTAELTSSSSEQKRRKSSIKPNTDSSSLILWLLGLRGFATCLVLSHHLGDLVLGPTKKNEERALYWIPLEIGLRGVSVGVFFVLSGFVLSLSYYRAKEKEQKALLIFKASVRRWFRLFVPTLVAALIAYAFLDRKAYVKAMNVLHLKEESQLFNQTDLDWIRNTLPLYRLQEVSKSETFFLFLRDVCFSIWIPGAYSAFNAAFWMLSWEWMGSLILFFLLYLTLSLKAWHRRLVFLFLCIGATWAPLYLGMAFVEMVAGSLLADLHVHRPSLPFFQSLRHSFLGRLCLNVWKWSLFFVAYYLISVSEQIPMMDSRYQWLNSIYGVWDMVTAVHYVGSILIVYSIQINPILTWVFSNFLFVFMGRLSFGLYLLHFLALYSVVCVVYEKIFTWSPWSIYFTLLPILFISTSIAAYLFARFIDEPWGRALRRIEKRVYHFREK